MNPHKLLRESFQQKDLEEVTARVVAAIDKRLEPGTYTVGDLVRSLRLIRDPGYPDQFNLAGIWVLDGKKLLEVTPRAFNPKPDEPGTIRSRRRYREL